MTTLESKLRALVAELRNKAQLDRNKQAEMNERLQRGEVVTCEAISGPMKDLREVCADRLEALLAERQEPSSLSIEPWLFGIEDAQGNWKDGEQCVFGDAVSAQDEVDLLNDDFEGEKEYRIVPLYRLAAAAPSSGTGERK